MLTETGASISTGNELHQELRSCGGLQMLELRELESACRRIAADAGVDGRTSYFAGVLTGDASPVEVLQDLTRLPTEAIERILRGYVGERYVDHAERRGRGHDRACREIEFLLSQGYRRGLVWRDLPLGKTCWDVCIYQQLLQETRPKTVLEFGTGLGASTLFFADQCRAFGIDTKIITIDINPEGVDSKVLDDPVIEFISGDVRQIVEVLPSERLRQLPHPWLVVEDCHMEIPRIVAHLQEFLVPGDYLVIEDVGVQARGSQEIVRALRSVPNGTLMVDTFYTDMFGRNSTCAPDAIFRRM